ncbi:MAG: 23S rRNA (pseudouridine(1915)-N(3))-methyltransferase RlmH [Candidatus Gastranaerophilales bacterium]|nr:23S rRNA (pseudouridine(1915)-N(3))-methyltransferase RlmH [Candidatus Gastranaerophilales bacterium]
MNIKIIAVGKIREKYLKEGTDEFLKRIQPFSSLKIIEIPAETINSESMEEKCRNIEAEKILNHISNTSYVITMEIAAKQYSSEDFAQKFKQFNQEGINELIFVIGGATGLGEIVLKRANEKISLSKMTLTHQMARLFLIEQIYRAFKINANEPYHK